MNSSKMLSYRLGTCTVNDLQRGFKPDLSYNKYHSFSKFIREDNENEMHFLILPRPLRSDILKTRYFV